jgi:hypothetical protein
MYKCDKCKKEIEYEPSAIQLNGTEDIYCFEVCDECYEIYSDYFEPEQVDKMMGVDNNVKKSNII